MSLGLIDSRHVLYQDSQLRIELDPINSPNHILYLYTGDYTDELKYGLQRGVLQEIAAATRDQLETRINILLGENFLEKAETLGLTADSIGLASLHAYTEEQKRNRIQEFEKRMKYAG